MKNQDYIRLYIAEDEQALLELLFLIFKTGYAYGFERELEEALSDPADLIRAFEAWLDEEKM